jgi:peptidoglycan/xylan/chitin deacetylase (PgdA/CDA1 family)
VPLSLWSRAIPRRELAFCWHLVGDRELPHISPLYRYRTAAQFEEDLAWLVSIRDVIDDRSLETRLLASDPGAVDGRSAALVTFDDGLVECFTNVRPILQRLGVRAVFFVVTGCLDNQSMLYRHKAALCVHRLRSLARDEHPALLEAAGRVLKTRFTDAGDAERATLAVGGDRAGLLDDLCAALGVDVGAYLATRRPYLTRAEVRALHDDGHVIGAHGVDHRELQTLPPEEAERQIVESCAAVAEITGRSRIPFAAPFTLDGLDRGWLAGIARRHRHVGLIFGTGGLAPEPPGLFNRIVADAGVMGPRLPALRPLVRGAYIERMRDAVRERLMSGGLLAPRPALRSPIGSPDGAM